MAAIAHAYTEQMTAQTTTSLTYVDVPGASITSGNFVAGKKYLIFANALFANSVTTVQSGIRLVHGTTPTAFNGAEALREPNSGTTNRNGYQFFTVWTAVAGEDVKLQFRAVSASTVTINQITLFAMNLSDDVVENTDWFFNDNTTATALAATESTANNATVTFTPAQAGKDWLVFSTSNITVSTLTVSYESEIARSGEATSTAPKSIIEPDSVETFVETQMRVFNLGAASNTFTEKSLTSSTTTGTRNYSGIFALNLAKFQNHGTVFNAGETDLSGTSYATNIATVTFTPSVATDIWIIGFYNWVATSATVATLARLQTDSADTPAGQTAAALTIAPNNDGRDEPDIVLQAVKNVTAASHTFNLDGSTVTAALGRGYRNGTIMAVTMELAAAAAPPIRNLSEIVLQSVSNASTF